MGFCVAKGIKQANSNGATLAYVHYLYQQNLGYKMITNYVSVIRESMKTLRVPYQAWESEVLKAFLTAISRKPIGSTHEISAVSI